MEQLQHAKKGIAILPQTLDGATATSYVIDTAGVDYVNIDVVIGTTDIAMTTLKVQESDTKTDSTTLSSGADITGLVYGASGYAALPTATDDNKIFSFEINTQGRKRYLQLVAVAGNGTTGVALAAQYNAGKIGNQSLDAAGKGVAAVLNV
jgi:hypothetical protein